MITTYPFFVFIKVKGVREEHLYFFFPFTQQENGGGAHLGLERPKSPTFFYPHRFSNLSKQKQESLPIVLGWTSNCLRGPFVALTSS